MSQQSPTPYKHIVILVDRYDSLGGIQKWANQIAAELHNREFTVHLIGLTKSPSEMSVDYERDQSINSITLLDSDSHQAYRGGVGKLRRVIAKLPTPVRDRIDSIIKGWRPSNLNESAVERLKSEITPLEGKAIIVVTSQLLLDYLGTTGLPIGKNTKTPLIAQYHNDFQLVAGKRHALEQFKTSYKIADRVVFLTESNKNLAIELGIQDTEVIPNPRPAVLNDAPVHNKRKIAVALGRLDRQKSFEYLIYAWKEVKKDYPDWQLHIYGSGPEEKRLHNLIKKFQLTPFVCLKGVTHAPLEVLREASLHLISSQHEGWALTISEAAAVSTPTIAFDSGPGIRAQITSEVNGILIEKNNTDLFSRAIKKLLSDQELLRKLGENALNDSARFSIDNVAENWVKIFHDVAR